MITEIMNYLQDSVSKSVKLYFIERNKNQRTKEITYNVFKAKINDFIGTELIKIGIDQLESELKGDPEYIEYGVLPYSDKEVVEYVKREDVPYLDDVIPEILGSNVQNFKMENADKITGYIVRVESDGKVLLLFKKYNSRRLLEKGKLSIVLHQGRFEDLNDNILVLDGLYDAMLFLKEGEDNGSANVFIFNRTQFEFMFSFIDFYENEVTEQKDNIDEKNIISDSNTFIELCKTDSRKIKKFARIVKNGSFDKMDIDNIHEIVDKFGLDLNFDGKGRVIVTDDNIWVVLRLLDDDHLISELTSSKYEARSKVKK